MAEQIPSDQRWERTCGPSHWKPAGWWVGSRDAARDIGQVDRLSVWRRSSEELMMDLDMGMDVDMEMLTGIRIG